MKKLLLICFFSSVSVFAFSQSTSKKQNTLKGNLQTSESAPAQPAPAPVPDPVIERKQKEAKLKADELKRRSLAADSDPAKTSN